MVDIEIFRENKIEIFEFIFLFGEMERRKIVVLNFDVIFRSYFMILIYIVNSFCLN